LAHNLRDFGNLVDVPPDHKDFAVCQRTQAKPHVLHFAAAVVDSNDHGVDRDVRRKAGRQPLYITNDWMPVRTEQANDPDAARILAQSAVRQ
jgi:hypothetical protein